MNHDLHISKLAQRLLAVMGLVGFSAAFVVAGLVLGWQLRKTEDLSAFQHEREVATAAAQQAAELVDKHMHAQFCGAD